MIRELQLDPHQWSRIIFEKKQTRIGNLSSQSLSVCLTGWFMIENPSGIFFFAFVVVMLISKSNYDLKLIGMFFMLGTSMSS